MKTIIFMVLVVIVLIQLCIIVENSKTINGLFRRNVHLVNMVNRRTHLPALTIKEMDDVNWLIHELESGPGFLDLAGYITPDKNKIELLKRLLKAYILESSNPTARDDLQQIVTLKRSINDILHELNPDNEWDLNHDNIKDVTTKAIEEIHKLRRDTIEKNRRE